jgi:hypothetical protein
VWAQAELRKVLTTAGARVVEAEVAVGHAPSKFGEAGELVDEEIVEQLSEAIDVLTAESAPCGPWPRRLTSCSPACRGCNADEVPTDAGLVRSLLEQQFPAWARSPIERVESFGTDNASTASAATGS